MKTLRVVFMTLVLLTFYGSLSGQTGTESERSEEMLVSTVRFLSEETGERSFRDGDKLNKAADYIENAFRSYGCVVKRQPFLYGGRTYFNVIAEVKGRDAAQNSVLIIGAHYDTAVGTPGADDNASGIAGLLELARLTALQPADRTVRFVAFSLEEYPAYGTEYMGSYVYAKSVKDEGAAVYGMIALEMIGFFCEEKGCQRYPLSILGWFFPDKGDYLSFVGNMPSRAFTRKVRNEFAKVSGLPIESLNTFSAVTGVDFSDHRNFWKFGFKAFMITDTAFYRNPHYHASGDTWEKLDYKRMGALVTGLHKAIMRL
jgi:peptidase M28-like protein